MVHNVTTLEGSSGMFVYMALEKYGVFLLTVTAKIKLFTISG